MYSFIKKITFLKQDVSGQATVESAFLIPIAFLLLLMLLQPAIIFYDRIVVNHSAAEAGRLLATGLSDGQSQDAYRGLLKRRLKAIPYEEHFHVDEDDGWIIEFEGGENRKTAKISISHRIKLLPLFDAGGALLRISDDQSCIQQKVSYEISLQPDWLEEVPEGRNPEAWIECRK